MPGNLSERAPTENLPSKNVGQADFPKHTSDIESSQHSQRYEVKSLSIDQGEGTEEIAEDERKEVNDAQYEKLSKRIETIEGAINRLADFTDGIKAAAANPATFAKQLKSIHDLVKGIVISMTKFTPEQNKIFLTEATELYQDLARDTNQNIASLETVVGRLTENMSFITAQCAQLHNKVNALGSHREADEEESAAISETLADVGRDIIQKLQDLEARVVGDEDGGIQDEGNVPSDGIRADGRQILRALKEVKKMLQAQAQGRDARDAKNGVRFVQVPPPLHQGPKGQKGRDWIRFPAIKFTLPNVRFHTPLWVEVLLHFFTELYITLLNNKLFNNTLVNNTNFLQISTFLGQTIIIYIFLIFGSWLIPQIFFLIFGPISPMAFAIPPPISIPVEAEAASHPVVLFLGDVLDANVRMVYLQIETYKALANVLVGYWGGFIAALF